MFDIGFWEIVVIAVVALLVVGPNEFPTLVRTIGGWIGKVRSFVSETKSDLDREFRKADELKQLLNKEAELAKLHQQVDPRTLKPVDDAVKPTAGANASSDQSSPIAEDPSAHQSTHHGQDK